MGFRDKKNKIEAPSTPTQALTATVSDPAAEVQRQLAEAQKAMNAAQAVSTAVVVAPPVQSSVPSTFLGDDESQLGALVAAADVDTAGPQQVFPTVTQQAGTTGGALAISKGTMRQWPNIDLPEGKRAFRAVFLAYRFNVACWPAGYDDAPGANAQKPRPAWSCAIPGTERDLAGKLMLAGKRYQFTGVAKRDAWDIASGGPGHLRPQIELLMLDPDEGQVFVVQSCAHYSSAQEVREALTALVVDVNGQKALRPFAGEFTPDTLEETSKSGSTFKVHRIKISRLDVASDPQALAMAKAFDAWRNAATPELAARITEWRAGADAPITQAARDGIAHGASM